MRLTLLHTSYTRRHRHTPTLHRRRLRHINSSRNNGRRYRRARTRRRCNKRANIIQTRIPSNLHLSQSTQFRTVKFQRRPKSLISNPLHNDNINIISIGRRRMHLRVIRVVRTMCHNSSILQRRQDTAMGQMRAGQITNRTGSTRIARHNTTRDTTIKCQDGIRLITSARSGLFNSKF